MQSVVDTHLEALHDVCRRFGVQALDAFGSVTGESFDPERSDVDFIVDFGPGAQPDLFDRYFGLKEGLERLFERKVDLVMSGAMTNPYFIEAVNRTRRPVYARPLTEVA